MFALTSVPRTSVVAWGVGGPFVGLDAGLMGGPSAFSNSTCKGSQRHDRKVLLLNLCACMGAVYNLCISASRLFSAATDLNAELTTRCEVYHIADVDSRRQG